VPPVSLSLDRTTYREGDVPSYTVTGEPDKVLQWTSTPNGNLTSEVEATYSTSTNAAGVWTGTGPAWTTAQVGWWLTYVRVNGRLAQFAFTVTP
jgi:hypothetical protein